MIKKMSVVLICVVLIASLSSCGLFNNESDDDFDYSDIEAAFSYLDPKIDMSLIISESGWRYEKDDEAGMVIFYEKADYDGLTSFAISSNTKREEEMTEADLEEIIDYMGEESKSIIQNGTASVDWNEADPIMVGIYDARRFSYTGKLKSTGSDVRGDYIFWWTPDRLYICSFIAFEDVYQTNNIILINALDTFRTYDEIEKGNDR